MNSDDDDDDVMIERTSVSQVFHCHSKQNSEYPVKDHCGMWNSIHDFQTTLIFAFPKEFRLVDHTCKNIKIQCKII